MGRVAKQRYCSADRIADHRTYCIRNGYPVPDYYEPSLQYFLMTVAMSEKKWYVIRAISGKEKKVKQYIESEIARLKLQDYVSQVLIPMEKVYQIKDGKKISKERSYFPGYVLIEATLTGEIPHIIENTTGVIGFLGAKGEAPAPLRVSEEKRRSGKVDEMEDYKESRHYT